MATVDGTASAPTVELRDAFWAPRQVQLRDHTLEVMLARLETQGSVGNFRRLAEATGERHRAMHFADSDVYKWLEAAVLAGRHDLADPVIAMIEAAQAPDGYLHTYYGHEGAPARYSDLDFGHEHYCFGHLIEAAVSHHEVTGDDRLLAVATRLADHLCATFGPGRDERTDAHPEIELALCRLAAATGESRYVDHARWTIESRLAAAGRTVDDYALGGHAVRALYVASGIAEVALATGDQRWSAAASRLFGLVVDVHSYPTGAVGGRWLGESVGKPYELPDAMSYAESCAGVASLQLAKRIWRLTGDPRALEQIELLLYNAVPCGVGADGESWFYSQPHAVAAVAPEENPWIYGFEYGQVMLLEWFPAQRHEWFDVPCCPPNLGRAFASVDRYVTEVDDHGDLLVHLPLACRVRGGGWDVEVHSGYPYEGSVRVEVHAAPADREVRVRVPVWAGGSGHVTVPVDGRIDLPVEWQWWETDPRVEGATGTVFARRGPVVHCVEGVDLVGTDLRDLVVDPGREVGEAFSARPGEGGSALHRPVRASDATDETAPLDVPLVPYAEWANRGATTMRYRFPTR